MERPANFSSTSVTPYSGIKRFEITIVLLMVTIFDTIQRRAGVMWTLGVERRSSLSMMNSSVMILVGMGVDNGLVDRTVR